MSGILSGVRIVELAQWIFVPSAGALLADLGADVIKIEHPRQGDPARGLRTQGMGGSITAAGRGARGGPRDRPRSRLRDAHARRVEAAAGEPG